MNHPARQNALWAGIGAMLMLYYGWRVGLQGTTPSNFYNTTVDVFDWMLKFGGIGLAIVAVLCFVGQRVGLLLDVFVSGICGTIMILCAVYWLGYGLMHGSGVDLQDLLFLIFGGMFVSSARGCWTAYRTSAAAGGRQAVQTTVLSPPVAPVHPASVRPVSLSEDGKPPPEGYLAALAKEKDEPPRASFE